MQTVAQELEEKTRAFWNTSKVFYTGVGKQLSMAEAIDYCNNAIEILGPQRLLKYRLFAFQDRLIHGRGRQKTSKKLSNITVLRQGAEALRG